MNKPFVYVAGPYTKPDPVLNVRVATQVADELLVHGFVPFVPHLCHLWHLISPKKYTEWTEYDIEWIRKCDVLFRIIGESSGSDDEVMFARSLRIPVCVRLVDLLYWKENEWKDRT